LITDEYFRERAAAERASAAGIRPLAHHVRALYVEIRTLREDGVGFKYIASVLIDARGQASCDPIDVTEKLRVYHHRDRKTLGDAVPALKPAGRGALPGPVARHQDVRPAKANPTPVSNPTGGSVMPSSTSSTEGLSDVSRAIQARAARKRLVADDTA
tara:strand:- start:27 stop:500 length:474 start_codon:yes stop_codon:yes gene_type:complete